MTTFDPDTAFVLAEEQFRELEAHLIRRDAWLWNDGVLWTPDQRDEPIPLLRSMRVEGGRKFEFVSAAGLRSFLSQERHWLTPAAHHIGMQLSYCALDTPLAIECLDRITRLLRSPFRRDRSLYVGCGIDPETVPGGYIGDCVLPLTLPTATGHRGYHYGDFGLVAREKPSYAKRHK